MKLKVSELSTQEETFQWEFPVSWVQATLEKDAERDSLNASLYTATNPLTLDVHVYRNDQDEVFFYGTTEGAIGFTCVRSLEDGKMDVTLDISGVFRPRQAGVVAEDEEDPSFYLYEGDEIDFGEVVREQLFLFLPLNPTLSDDLPISPEQLAQASGNQATEKGVDPRWSALLNIQKKMGQNKPS
ncbi:MAG: DUF177 domain-containing protein [Myxococcales bacterium]|nr:DUF177 domain-containing protein [Myxococcales bacterium]MCB9643371.1 DUF177 domain-containing protein [Myxococcales bacterium]